MGRGRSKGGGAGVVTILTVGNDTVDLTNSPLVYGGKDPALTAASRAVVEAFEKKYAAASIEHLHISKDDGTVVLVKSGSSGQVSVSGYSLNKGNVVSHNHPASAGCIGGTFSPDDVGTFGTSPNIHTIRATSKEGTYSMTKGTNFHGRSLMSALKKTVTAENAAHNQRCQKYVNDYKAGKMTRAQAQKHIDADFNIFLVNMHNFFLANQNKYDYTYTLEKT